MTNVTTFTQLPVAVSLNGTEVLALVQAGVSVQGTVAQIVTLLQPPPSIPNTETIGFGGSFQLDGRVQDVLIQLSVAANVDLTLPPGNYGQRLSVMDAGGTAGTDRIRIHSPTKLNASTGAGAYTDITTPYGWAYFKCVSSGVWIIAG